MTRPGTTNMGSLFFLQIMTGVFFIIVGLQVLLDFNSTGGQITMGISRMFGRLDYVIQITIAVLELLSGIVIIAALFVSVRESMVRLAMLIIIVIWAARMVYVYFIAREVFKPAVLTWLKDISLDGIILMALWLLRSRAA
jgi:hypothetical protein